MAYINFKEENYKLKIQLEILSIMNLQKKSMLRKTKLVLKSFIMQ